MSKGKRAVNYQLTAKEVGNNQAKLIKKFCKKVKKLGIIKEHLDKKYYVKPSERRRKKKLRSKRVAQKANQEQNQEQNQKHNQQ